MIEIVAGAGVLLMLVIVFVFGYQAKHGVRTPHGPGRDSDDF